MRFSISSLEAIQDSRIVGRQFTGCDPGLGFVDERAPIGPYVRADETEVVQIEHILEAVQRRLDARRARLI
jgi:hypothetical protein